MRLSLASALVALIFSNIPMALATSSTTSPQPAITTPAPKEIFMGQILLGSPLKPIPVPGGARLIEPITGGKISGATINGTIIAGFAAPILTHNGTFQLVDIYAYGNTTDGETFYVQESGVGPNAGQVTRIQLEVGGRYTYLQDAFILATIEASADRRVVSVQGFSVPQPVLG